MLPENSRSIFIASVEYQEGVGLPKEIFLVQLIGTELHCGDILIGEGKGKQRCEGGEDWRSPQSLWKYSHRALANMRVPGTKLVREGSILHLSHTDKSQALG